MTRVQGAAVMLLLGALLTLSSCGGTTTASHRTGGSAQAFVRQITNEFSLGQSGRLWDSLLPADQRLVSRSRFVECQADTGWNLKSFKVLDSYSDPVSVGARTLPAQAVSVRVASDDGITTATMHAVLVGGTWRWLFQPSDRRSYANGACPRSG